MDQDLTITISDYDAVIFDLDGVITRTEKVHFNAWKRMFDEYLGERSGTERRPFDREDYLRYVDGKPRYEGVGSFLESRGIELPYGAPDDGPEKETICGLGNRKNRFFNELLEEEGVELYDPAVDLLRELRSRGFKTAVVSSSKNCVPVLEAAGILDLFDVKIDGVDAQRLGVQGKPSPDMFLAACERLDVGPDRTVVLEDAISGVEAGKRGRFALVIGVDRAGHGQNLEAAGADVVVTSLSSINVGNQNIGLGASVPSALESIQEILSKIEGKDLAIFLDYDGTLTPIVDDPGKALLSDPMRKTLVELSERVPVAVISGRDLPDVRKLVDIGTLYYAGSHGFDISGPEGMETRHEKGADFLPSLDKAERELREKLGTFSGAWVERKRFSIAVHYRKVAEESDVESVKKTVKKVAGLHEDLRMSGGKKIFELQPRMDWHKGKALLWFLRELDVDKESVVPFYIGDDATDEDAFRVLKDRGISIVVMDRHRHTEAGYRLKNPGEVERFLGKLVSARKGEA